MDRSHRPRRQPPLYCSLGAVQRILGSSEFSGTAAHRNYVQALYFLTKTLDPTRPVIGNDGWESIDTDILAIHDYDNNPKTLAKRYGQVQLSDLFDYGRPGGRILTLGRPPAPRTADDADRIRWHRLRRQRKPRLLQSLGLHRAWDTKELQRRYTALLKVVNKVEMFSGFCYTQLTDTYQEANGLLYADRTPKFFP